MAAVKIMKAYIDLPEGQIHYRYTTNPGSKTPIIFLHKSASSSASCAALQHYYAALGHPTYAPDLPGFGQSFDPTPSPDEPLTTAWYCKTLFSVFSQLGLKTFHLVGHHSGACLSLELAVLYPESVLSITLIGPAIMSPSERLDMKARFYAPFNAPVASGEHLMATWKYLIKMGCPETDLEMLQRELLDHARAWKGRTMIYGAVWEQDAQDLFKKVSCKVLCLCAEDDVLWPFWHWVTELRDDVIAGVVTGANFECELDVKGVIGWLDKILTH